MIEHPFFLMDFCYLYWFQSNLFIIIYILQWIFNISVPTHITSVSETQPEYVYEEQINDWQNYDPRHIDTQNGYMKIVNRSKNITNIERNYQNHETHVVTENIIYDDDIITEDYITTEDYTTDNVIEMETDATSYTTNDVTFVSNNVVGS